MIDMKKIVKWISVSTIIILLFSCNRDTDKLSSYLAISNEEYSKNIDKTINQIKVCTNNQYYLAEVKTYTENFTKIIDLIDKNENEKANNQIQELVKKQELSIDALVKFEFLDKNNPISKSLMINRLLCIENSLIQDLYSMNVRSNFELDKVKLYTVDGKRENGVYTAKVVIAAINSEQKYKVVINNDTINEYEGSFPIFRDTNPQKGKNKIECTLCVYCWGRIASYPLELNYDVN